MVLYLVTDWFLIIIYYNHVKFWWDDTLACETLLSAGNILGISRGVHLMISFQLFSVFQGVCRRAMCKAFGSFFGFHKIVLSGKNCQNFCQKQVLTK